MSMVRGLISAVGLGLASLGAGNFFNNLPGVIQISAVVIGILLAVIPIWPSIKALRVAPSGLETVPEAKATSTPLPQPSIRIGNFSGGSLDDVSSTSNAPVLNIDDAPGATITRIDHLPRTTEL
ncbi:MAG TPA: hypothetical protein VMR39_19160 [Sphingobium sp.]|nr:hypothetical protein [Sphingobium sp.]